VTEIIVHPTERKKEATDKRAKATDMNQSDTVKTLHKSVCSVPSIK